MTAPTRALRQRIKPLCRLCLRSSCTARLAWPGVCRGGQLAEPQGMDQLRASAREARALLDDAPPQFTSGLADVRAGRMLSDDELQQRITKLYAELDADQAPPAEAEDLAQAMSDESVRKNGRRLFSPEQCLAQIRSLRGVSGPVVGTAAPIYTPAPPDWTKVRAARLASETARQAAAPRQAETRQSGLADMRSGRMLFDDELDLLNPSVPPMDVQALGASVRRPRSPVSPALPLPTRKPSFRLQAWRLRQGLRTVQSASWRARGR